MDLSLRVEGRKITTDLFKKALNLYLYIPPHSAHPPGILTGLVLGHTYRIYTLCLDEDDIKRHLREFHTRLIARGYSPNAIHHLFIKAAGLARERRAVSATGTERDNTKNDGSKAVFLHLPFHPCDPCSRAIQRVWHDVVAELAGALPLHCCKKHNSAEIDIRRMIIAYSRPLNLGNLLSYRELSDSLAP